MITKNQIKYINSFKEKKQRIEYNKFIVEGVKCVDEAINSNIKIDSIFALENWFHKNSAINVPVQIVTEDELYKISNQTTPNQVIALANIPENKINSLFYEKDLTLVLDNIQDPGNLGTIIRIADWFGINQIICSENTVDAFNPKVVQSAMGSLFRSNICYTDIFNLLNTSAEKINIYGALLGGTNIYSTILENSGFIVLGNESKGISENIKKLIKKAIFIPDFNNSAEKAESLNVSVAAGIICSEFRRRK